MENNDICDFLLLKSKDEQIQSMKAWLGLFIAFTIVFMDIGFILNFSTRKFLIFIPIFYTLLAFIIWMLYFTVCKKISKHISYSILYIASVNTVTALLFFSLLLMCIMAGKVDFSIAHIVALLISFVMWLYILIYRAYKFKYNRKKEGKTSYYILVAPAVILFVPILKSALSAFNKYFILSIAFLLLGGIWMLISLIDWQNYYYGKKNKIDEIYCSKN